MRLCEPEFGLSNVAFHPSPVHDLHVQFRFLGQEIISNQSRDEIRHESSDGTMSGMLNLTNVFKLVIDGLYEGAFAQCEFVVQTHQRVLHVLLDSGDQMNAVHEQFLKEGL